MPNTNVIFLLRCTYYTRTHFGNKRRCKNIFHCSPYCCCPSYNEVSNILTYNVCFKVNDKVSSSQFENMLGYWKLQRDIFNSKTLNLLALSSHLCWKRLFLNTTSKEQSWNQRWRKLLRKSDLQPMGMDLGRIIELLLYCTWAGYILRLINA